MNDREKWLWNYWFDEFENYEKPTDQIKYLLIKDRLHHLNMSLLLNRPRSTQLILQSLEVPEGLSLKQGIAFVQLIGETL